MLQDVSSSITWAERSHGKHGQEKYVSQALSNGIVDGRNQANHLECMKPCKYNVNTGK